MNERRDGIKLACNQFSVLFPAKVDYISVATHPHAANSHVENFCRNLIVWLI